MVHEDEIVDFKNPSSGNYIIKRGIHGMMVTFQLHTATKRSQ